MPACVLGCLRQRLDARRPNYPAAGCFFLNKHRGCKSLISFFSLPTCYRKDFYGKDVDFNIDTRGETLTYLSAEQVARQLALAITIMFISATCPYGPVESITEPYGFVIEIQSL